jgi:hypothetical protein
VGLYINVGCGFDAPEGWLNFDASPTLRFERIALLGRLYTKNGVRFPAAARFGDIVRGPLCPPGAADGVYASHVLEHLTLDDARTALAHVFAMLTAGGLFRVVVPDLETRARAYVAAAERGEEGAAEAFLRESLLGRETAPRGLLGRLSAALGHQAHLWMWDERSLSAALRHAGFSDIRRCAFGDCADPMFAKVESKVRFDSEFGPELALECRK